MSRLFEMTIDIEGYDPDRLWAIEDVVGDIWKIDDTYGPDKDKNEITFIGQSQLTGGETDDEFAKKLARAVFKANRGPCDITVKSVYMEELPSEYFRFDKDDFSKLEEELKEEWAEEDGED